MTELYDLFHSYFILKHMFWFPEGVLELTDELFYTPDINNKILAIEILKGTKTNGEQTIYT